MSERLTDAELSELERLDREATPGPWDTDLETSAGRCWVDSRRHQNMLAEPLFNVRPPSARHMEQRERDASFIAAARNALPKLLAEIRELRAEIAKRCRDCRWEDDDE
jgi:hypothetical protein